MKMHKKMLLVFIGLILGMGAMSVHVRAETANTVVFHYFRFDHDYTGWSLWLWPYEPVNGKGARFTFSGDDEYGKVLVMDLDGTILEGSTKIGFIVSTPDWEKDVSSDRYADLTAPNENGEVHIYLIQGDETIYYDREDADTSDRIMWARFTNEDTIGFETTQPVTADKVSLLENGVLISFTAFSATGRVASIQLTQPVNLYASYELVVDLGGTEPAKKTVGLDGIFDSEVFESAFGFDGDLGALYTPTATTFRLWAPISQSVTLNLYTKGHKSTQTDGYGTVGVDVPSQTVPMVAGEKGTWSVTVEGDLNCVYYTYTVTNAGIPHEVVDPYARAAGVNGDRGMVVDFSLYEPDGWEEDVRPQTMDAYTDAIIYELHVRDLTTSETWNGTEAYRGKFLGLIESGTTYAGLSTGFDHMKELGITHVQLLPVFDHGVIDETRLNDPSYQGITDGIFNWGYMPENFNVVEGSYSTDPYNGEVRIREFKEMVQAFHANDIRVIMDVVYNHTGQSADSNFNLIVPGYYFRMTADGKFSNGSGTGNETASERKMVQKFIVDSTLFWVNEYHVDGFRFDLMKLHDVDTMNAVADALHAVDPTIMVYGEPWTGGTSPLPEAEAAYNATLSRMPGVAVFNDDTRDGIKGSVFESASAGFVQGYRFYDARILLGVTGGTRQTGINTALLPKGAWAQEPTQTINYVECHDNNTLYDKLMLSTSGDPAKVLRMHKQAYAMVFLSQGIAFMQAGSEFLRSKPCAGDQNTCDINDLYDHNSYRSNDATNQIDWSLKEEHLETYRYFQNLIALRKMRDVFTLSTKAEITASLEIVPDTNGGMVSYLLKDADDLWTEIYVVFNGGDSAYDITLPEGTWEVILTTDAIGSIRQAWFEEAWVPAFTSLSTLTGGATLSLTPNDSYVMVKYHEDYISETNRISTVLSGLSIPESVEEDRVLSLPTNVEGVELNYTSSDPFRVDPLTGAVTVKDAKNQIVTLTITGTFGSYTQTRVVEITINEPGLSGWAIGGIVGGSVTVIAAAILILLRKKIFKI